VLGASLSGHLNTAASKSPADAVPVPSASSRTGRRCLNTWKRGLIRRLWSSLQNFKPAILAYIAAAI
jgi:hypothetical protein